MVKKICTFLIENLKKDRNGSEVNQTMMVSSHCKIGSQAKILLIFSLVVVCVAIAVTASQRLLISCNRRSDFDGLNDPRFHPLGKHILFDYGLELFHYSRVGIDWQ